MVQPLGLRRLTAGAALTPGLISTGTSAGVVSRADGRRTQSLSWRCGWPCCIPNARCDRPLSRHCATRPRHSASFSMFAITTSDSKKSKYGQIV